VYEGDIMFDPQYFRCHSSHALLHTITDHYLNERGFTYIMCGWRSLSHETNYQEFIEKKFMRRKAYCKIGLEFSFLLKIVALFAYYCKFIWDRNYLPRSIKEKLKIIYQLYKIKKAQDTS
jgi:hypothetical protein